MSEIKLTSESKANIQISTNEIAIHETLWAEMSSELCSLEYKGVNSAHLINQAIVNSEFTIKIYLPQEIQ